MGSEEKPAEFDLASNMSTEIGQWAQMVPEFLPVDTHPFDQPPFNLIPQVKDLYADDFFEVEGDFDSSVSWKYFLRAAMYKNSRWGKREQPKYVKAAKERINSKYLQGEGMRSLENSIRKVRFFLDKFPYWKEYMADRWDPMGEKNFDDDGVRLASWQPGVNTYAAYVWNRQKLERGLKYAGLAFDLEDLGLSEGEDIADVSRATTKGPVNRWYRVVVKSEALK